MKKDVENYVRTCEICQINKAKFVPKADEMIIRERVPVPMHTTHLDFAELAKKSDGIARTRSFLVVIDVHTRYVAAKCGGENAHCVIDLLNQDIFRNVKVIRSDKAKVFESKVLRDWCAERNIKIETGSPYHPQSNGIVERVIRKIKTFMSMYPNYTGGYKKCLEAAIMHYNRSHHKTIGCSPLFALKGEVPVLEADFELKVLDKIVLYEKRRSIEEEQKQRVQQKVNFDKRNNQNFQSFKVGDQILVRRGLPPNNKKFYGPFEITGIEFFDMIPKRIRYINERDKLDVATIRNVVKFHSRSNGQRGGGSG